jgi:hypothetical protein
MSLIDSSVKLAVARLYQVPNAALENLPINARIALISLALDSLVWVLLPLFLVGRVWVFLAGVWGRIGVNSSSENCLEDSPTTCVEPVHGRKGKANLKVSWNPQVQTFDDAVSPSNTPSNTPSTAHYNTGSNTIQPKVSSDVTPKDVHSIPSTQATKNVTQTAQPTEDLSSISNDSFDMDQLETAPQIELSKEYVFYRSELTDRIDLFELPSMNDSFAKPRGPQTPAVAARRLHMARTPVQNTPYRVKMHANRLANQILDDLIDNVVWNSELGGLVEPDALDVIGDGEWDAMLQPVPSARSVQSVRALPSARSVQSARAAQSVQSTQSIQSGQFAQSVQSTQALQAAQHSVQRPQTSQTSLVSQTTTQSTLPRQIGDLPPLPTAATSADFRTRLEALQRIKRDQSKISSHSFAAIGTPVHKDVAVTTTDSGRKLYYQRTAHRDSGGGTRLSNLFEKALRK